MIVNILATFKQPVRLLLEVLVLLVKIYFVFLWKIFRVFIPKSLRFSDGSLQADLILVTGCGNGLTRHVVLKLAEMGASLVLWDNDKEAVRSVAEEAESYGTQVYPFACDCSDQDTIYSTAKKVQQEVGNVSILINNLSDSTAGKDVMSMDDARLAQVMKTNFYSNYWITKAFLPWMVHNDYGHIVNMVTQPLFCGLAGNSDHAASKAAVLAFSEALRSELVSMDKTGVHVVCVCPWKENYSVTELPKMAEQVIEAMLEQEPFVTLPRYKYLMIILKCILPSGVLNLISKFLNKYSRR